MMRIRLGILAAFMASVGLSACTATVTAPRVVVHTPEVVVPEVVVARPPPPVRVEVVPAPPPGHPEMFVWQPGHWHWNGHDYEWHAGHYDKRPSQSAVWVQAEWVSRGGQWVFKPGHWAYH